MKKNIFLFYLAFLFFCILLSAAAQQAEDVLIEEVPEGYVFYRYQYFYLDISLIYPEKWLNYSSQERGILIDTPDSQGSIMISGHPTFREDNTLEKLWAENKESLELAGAIFQESVPDTFSGYPAIKALHTIKIGNNIHRYLRYSTVVDDMYYTFSFQAPAEEFEKYLEEVLTIAHSVLIKTVE